MSPYSWSPPSGRFLSFAEREEIALLRARGDGVRQLAAVLGRSPSTISRELRRNAATRGGKWITARRLPSGKPSCSPGARRAPSWRRTPACASTSSSVWPGRSQGLTGSRWPAPTSARGPDGTSHTGLIAAGRRRGARGRSPNDWRSISPMTGRCGPAM
ncbi:helix-turn-helix domain-containing protein [Nocardia sp. NPDC051929]|uniref:helix-turn-helix domain-containing protein n=1 Tax=Nocardia sp. NPDC051929 TaxID=3364327 RepID=UPI0037C63BD2